MILFVGNRINSADKPLPDHLKELAWAYAITIEKPPPLPEGDILTYVELFKAEES